MVIKNIESFRKYADKYRKEDKTTIADYYDHIANSQELLDELEERYTKREITHQERMRKFKEFNNNYWDNLTEDEITEINNHIKRLDIQLQNRLKFLSP